MNIRVKFDPHILNKVLRRVRETTVREIHVGVIGPKAEEPVALPDGDPITLGEDAIIQNFGTEHIPPRPFLMKTFRKHKDDVVATFTKAGYDLIEEGATAEAVFDVAGEHLARLVHDSVEDQSVHLRRNAKATVGKKGFDHPLLETGKLIGAVTHRVVRGTGDVLDAGSSAGEYEAFEVGNGGDE